MRLRRKLSDLKGAAVERPESTAGPDYFRLFNLPQSYCLDTVELQARYRSLQQQLHPDRFVSGTPREQRLALQRTGLLNRAFQVLQSPVERAKHLLECLGVRIAPEETVSADPAFLVSQIESREQLAALCKAGDTAGLAALARQTSANFDERARAFTEAVAGDELEKARQLFLEMQFIARLGEEIAEARLA